MGLDHLIGEKNITDRSKPRAPSCRSSLPNGLHFGPNRLAPTPPPMHTSKTQKGIKTVTVNTKSRNMQTRYSIPKPYSQLTTSGILESPSSILVPQHTHPRSHTHVSQLQVGLWRHSVPPIYLHMLAMPTYTPTLSDALETQQMESSDFPPRSETLVTSRLGHAMTPAYAK